MEHFNLEITKETDNLFQVNEVYEIELERNNLFKLTCNGEVVAPFSDVEELCLFIKRDLELNEES